MVSRERLGRTPRFSYSRLTISHGLVGFAIISGLCGIGGLFDDVGDATVLLAAAAVTGVVGIGGRRTFVRTRRPAPGRVVAALASTWAAFVLAGTVVYLATDTTSRVDDALFESAAGFSTTALTALAVDDLSSTMHVWRAATQWLGGLLGILVTVVALPSVMRGSIHVPKGEGRRIDRLAPTPDLGRRRVAALYTSLTALCGIGYLVTGMGARDSMVHALSTLSTGGFSSRSDSLVSASTGSQIVATLFMIIAGMSYFVLWWAVRKQGRRFIASTELRLYLTIILLAAVGIFLTVDGISPFEAVFTAASAVSTTGFAIVDWTVFPSAALSVLLVVVATGAMGSSAGGGLRIVRARVLVDYANRELRRQLDPNSVTVVVSDHRVIDDRELERISGYQIAHFGLCTLGAFFLAAVGVELVTSLWTAISAVSTFGPAPGTGPFGNATALGADGRLLLIPGMLAGRLTILPLLLAIAGAMRGKDRAVRLIKRRTRRSR